MRRRRIAGRVTVTPGCDGAGMDVETRDLRTALEKWARNVEPRLLDGAGAARQLRQVGADEGHRRLGRDASGSPGGGDQRLAARRPQDARAFRGPPDRDQHPPGGRDLADRGAARVAPATADAFATGRVTQAQVAEIAPAAVVAPEAETELLGLAADRNHAGLRDEARRISAAAADALERHRRAHAARACAPGPTRPAPGTSTPTAPHQTAPGSWPGSTLRPTPSSPRRADRVRSTSVSRSTLTASTLSSASPSHAATKGLRPRPTSS